jgi:hypothetical protein
MYYKFLLLLFFSLSAEAQIKSHMFRFSSNLNDKIPIIERVNLATFPNLVREAIAEKKIIVHKENRNPNVQFIYSYISYNDKILLNQEEVVSIAVNSSNTGTNFEKQKYIPFIGFHHHDRAKYYGLLPVNFIKKLSPSDKQISKPIDILLNHSTNDKLTIVYGLCPKDRLEVCDITVKHKGKWVRDKNNNVKHFKALAQSKRENVNSNYSYRLADNSDTPQGVYGLWASMFSSHSDFGCQPRIDIDLNAIPINGYRYSIFSTIIEELVPASLLEEYWINELPLAYAMGRSLFRIHANPIENQKPCDYVTPTSKLQFARTSGCLNMGNEMSEFYSLMMKLGVFNEPYTGLDCNDKHPIQWHATTNERFGKAFLIIKDV